MNIINLTKNLKIIGRNSDIVNVGGLLVNLIEIENELYKLKEINQSAVYTKRNKLVGNVIICDVVTNNLDLKPSDISKKLKTLLPKYKIPRIINIVNKLKVTKTGKLKKS